MIIKHLPTPIRSKAVKYWFEYRNLSFFDINDEVMNAAYNTRLFNAFAWKKTEQGETYWRLCNEERFKEAEEYLSNLRKSKTEYMMDGQPIYTEAVPTIKKHNLKPLPSIGATARTLLAVLIGGVIAVGILFIQTILNK
jgi:hypothetical protein